MGACLTRVGPKRGGAGSHTLILLKVGDGLLIFGALASIDAMRGAPGQEMSSEALAMSVEAAGKCLEALSRSKKVRNPQRTAERSI